MVDLKRLFITIAILCAALGIVALKAHTEHTHKKPPPACTP